MGRGDLLLLCENISMSGKYESLICGQYVNHMWLHHSLKKPFLSCMHYLKGLFVPKRKVNSDAIGKPVLIQLLLRL